MGGVSQVLGCRFGVCVVGALQCVSVLGPTVLFGVVSEFKFYKLLLQSLESLRGWSSCGSPSLCLLETSDFFLNLKLAGGPLFCRIPNAPGKYSRQLRAPVMRGGLRGEQVSVSVVATEPVDDFNVTATCEAPVGGI